MFSCFLFPCQLCREMEGRGGERERERERETGGGIFFYLSVIFCSLFPRGFPAYNIMGVSKLSCQVLHFLCKFFCFFLDCWWNGVLKIEFLSRWRLSRRYLHHWTDSVTSILCLILLFITCTFLLNLTHRVLMTSLIWKCCKYSMKEKWR